jgi:hypothetical protein
MEMLKLYPIFSTGFDMTLLPSILSLFNGATLTENSHDIVVSANFGGLELQLDLVADPHDPFKYHSVNGQKTVVGGDIAKVTVTVASTLISGLALKATGLDAHAKVFMHDFLAAQYERSLIDLAKPGPITIKPAGSTTGGGDTLFVPGVHAIFDVRGVTGHEIAELKHGDKVEVSKEVFHNKTILGHDLTDDGHGGWLLAVPGDMTNSVDLELASGHAITKAQALSYLLLHA